MYVPLGSEVRTVVTCVVSAFASTIGMSSISSLLWLSSSAMSAILPSGSSDLPRSASVINAIVATPASKTRAEPDRLKPHASGAVQLFDAVDRLVVPASRTGSALRSSRRRVGNQHAVFEHIQLIGQAHQETDEGRIIAHAVVVHVPQQRRGVLRGAELLDHALGLAQVRMQPVAADLPVIAKIIAPPGVEVVPNLALVRGELPVDPFDLLFVEVEQSLAAILGGELAVVDQVNERLCFFRFGVGAVRQ